MSTSTSPQAKTQARQLFPLRVFRGVPELHRFPSMPLVILLSGLLIVLLSSCRGAFSNSSAKENREAYLKYEEKMLSDVTYWKSLNPEERFISYNILMSRFKVEKENVRPSARIATEQTLSTFLNLKAAPKSVQQKIEALDSITLNLLNTKDQDPYNSFYLYDLATHYLQRDEKDFALWLLWEYYDKFPDLELPQHPSVRYLMLDILGRLSNNLNQRIFAIQQILDSNISSAKRTLWLYRMGDALERKVSQGEYASDTERKLLLERAMLTYQAFLNSDTNLPELREIRSDVSHKLSIYQSRRNWYTDKDLSSLIQRIKTAIYNRNISAILFYQANDFFVLSSDYRDDEYKRGTTIYLPNFLGNNIIFGQLTPESNDQEAWLYSSNWPFYISTWYLYFRRIKYPSDPSIHGSWEWAGIYLGDFY